MEQIELYDMLKEFIKENKECETRNKDEHKEIFTALNKINTQLASIQTAQENIIDNRQECNRTLEDHENRLREVESLNRLKELPDRVDRLARQVYGVGGAMAVIMLIASWILKSQGG